LYIFNYFLRINCVFYFFTPALQFTFYLFIYLFTVSITLSLREKCRLRVFENRVLRKIFGAKRDKVTGEWRRLHNKELHVLYFSSQKDRWAGHVARMAESRGTHGVFVGKPEGRRPLDRPRHKC
jgi:hypothetical protein